MAIIPFLLQAIPLAFIGGIALAYVVGMPVYGLCVGVRRAYQVLKRDRG